MFIELNIETVFNFTSIVLSAYIGIYLIFNKLGNRKANFFLGGYLILTSLSVLGGELEYITDSDLFNLVFTPLLSVYLPITVLFYYSLAITNRYKSEARKYRWLLIPVIVEILFQYIPFSINEDTLFLEASNDILLLFSYPFSLFIYALVLIQLKKHNDNILTLFSSIEDKELNWLKHLIMINVWFMIIWIIDDSLMFIIGENSVSEFISGLSLFATFITIIWIGFAGTKQPQIFDSIIKTSSSKKEQPTTITDQNKFAEIKKRIEEENLFTDTNLSLKELAQILEIRDKELSRLINQCYENNFFHFINSYRVNYFKELMKNPKNKNLSIVGLSMEAGFKSKSTFYTAFKKIEGKTPTSY
tara:strand:- start:2265 stop:3344 length:1080 start_codon:yes stop_codon:yes gene_type:complete